MPKIDNIEETPNPNAIKFILKEPVTPARHAPSTAPRRPRATRWPNRSSRSGDVSSVFYMDKMITVEKADEADWDDLLPRLAVPIRAAEGVGDERRRGAAARERAAAAASAARSARC